MTPNADNLKNTDLTLEGNVATWVMPRTEGSTGGTYTGTFQFRCWLSPTQILQAGRVLREYLGEHAKLATETEFNLAYALSQLSQRIIKAPPFWSSTLPDSGLQGNIGDLEVIMLVMDAADRSQALYQERVAKERELALEQAIKKAETKLQGKNV